jgi:hypothetical protein
MGNIYSILDLKQEDEKNKIIEKEVIELEKNIKNIDLMLKMLNNKCDNILTKLVEVDNKTYELLETTSNNKSIKDFGNEWDYYDFNQTINFINTEKMKLD